MLTGVATYNNQPPSIYNCHQAALIWQPFKVYILRHPYIYSLVSLDEFQPLYTIVPSTSLLLQRHHVTHRNIDFIPFDDLITRTGIGGAAIHCKSAKSIVAEHVESSVGALQGGPIRGIIVDVSLKLTAFPSCGGRIRITIRQ